MKITNANNATYRFDKNEVYLIMMYAFGYLDLSEKGHLPIALDRDPKTAVFHDKLKQCMRNHIKIEERTKRIKY